MIMLDQNILKNRNCFAAYITTDDIYKDIAQGVETNLMLKIMN